MAAALAAAVVFAAAGWSQLARPPSVPAAANPPGNNGTIKIDGVPFDDHPDNQPHVGCIFQVDFYGFDASRTYSLSPVLGSYAVNPQQGFHIKVEVNAPGSIGADKKSKVFWVQSCVSSGGDS